MKTDHIKTTLIILCAVALALGVLTAVVVFYPTGSYQPVIIQNRGTAPSSTFSSSTFSYASTTATTTASTTSPAPGQFLSQYASPYPVTWSEGNEHFSIIGASFQNNQLTLTLGIQMGNVSECVPANLRLVADESGTLKAPDSPAGGTFTFPDTQNCNGTPGATYSEPATFTINPSIASPYLFTTGGASNVFFNVATNSVGGVDVALPSRSG